jgi:hypothetical protein
MQPIQILDQTHRAANQSLLTYAAADANRSFWTGRIPIAGRIHGSICPACSRIVLHGEPPAEVSPAPTPDGRGSEPAAE